MKYPKELFLADISESAKKLYKVMRGLSGERKDPKCFAKVPTLASKLGKSVRYTRELLRQLETEELIEGQFRKRAPTIYSFPKEKSKIEQVEREHQLKTMPYSEYLQTPEWKEKRAAALKRAGYQCQLCTKDHTELHVHHKTYKNRGAEKDEDLIVLCNICHKRHHQK